jgi:hypothetical protein
VESQPSVVVNNLKDTFSAKARDARKVEPITNITNAPMANAKRLFHVTLVQDRFDSRLSKKKSPPIMNVGE